VEKARVAVADKHDVVEVLELDEVDDVFTGGLPRSPGGW
jgi:hypothetical protein